MLPQEAHPFHRMFRPCYLSFVTRFSYGFEIASISAVAPLLVPCVCPTVLTRPTPQLSGVVQAGGQTKGQQGAEEGRISGTPQARLSSWVGGGSDRAEEGQATEGSEEDTPALRASRAEGLTAAPSPWPETRTPADPSGVGTGSVRHSTGTREGGFAGLSLCAYGQGLRPEESRWLPAWAGSEMRRSRPVCPVCRRLKAASPPD